MFLENTHIEASSSGWIEVITGSMFSGKTEELIRRLRRAQIAQQAVEIFKPQIDNRYSATEIVSHDAKAIKSTVVSSSKEILKIIGNAKVVGIDEAQFFDKEIVDVCNQLANNGIRVIVAGLDMDFMGKPFEPMPQLLAVAEYVTKVHAICIRCGNLAHFSHRTSSSQNVIEIGEKDKYEPLCRNCYNKQTSTLKTN